MASLYMRVKMSIALLLSIAYMPAPLQGIQPYSIPSEVMVKTVDAQADFEFACIGEGPAGMVVVGLLLDLGINPKSIIWVGPEFKVGRLGEYPEVPANSTTKSFFAFVRACKAFSECNSPALQALMAQSPQKEYPLLQELLQPLQDISDHLCSRVHTMKGMLTALDFAHDVWQVSVTGAKFTARRVVLATGSHPRSLNYSYSTIAGNNSSGEIPLDIALNKSMLAQEVSHTDTVAVIGSAHSAVLVMKFLFELGIDRIVNFYNKELLYAVDMGTWVLHTATGLRGEAAEWARTVLEKERPAKILRLLNTESSRTAWLPVCNKIVYAIGYDRNQVPAINGSQQPITYDATSGTIAPHLFGIGIAFPEAYVDPVGNTEHRVGLNSFMAYAQRVLPEWMNKDISHRFRDCGDLFIIREL